MHLSICQFSVFLCTAMLFNASQPNLAHGLLSPYTQRNHGPNYTEVRQVLRTEQNPHRLSRLVKGLGMGGGGASRTSSFIIKSYKCYKLKRLKKYSTNSYMVFHSHWHSGTSSLQWQNFNIDAKISTPKCEITLC